MSATLDLIDELRRHFSGDIRLDLATRTLYSTDASIYKIEPLGVVLPRREEDLQAVVELAAKHRVPILPRGAGTSLAGQAIGSGLIIDCSRWLDQIIKINPETATATIEPGVILSTLNRAAAAYGLMFGPDPASADRATMGGVVGNNATGAHSILYGMAADHLVSAEVVMGDGSLASLGDMPVDSIGKKYADQSLIGSLYSTALNIREDYGDAIRERYPRTWRNSAGYRLNYLLPWSASRPPSWGKGQANWVGDEIPSDKAIAYPPVRRSHINLAHLLAGSEGTLAIMRRITVRLVTKPQHSALAVLDYHSVAEACDDVPRLLTYSPSAIELIPGMLVRLARRVPAYASQLDWVKDDPAALLVIEFAGSNEKEVAEKAHACCPNMRVAITREEQNRIWNVRKAGLGLLDAAPVTARPIAFIEDCAIPVEKLGEFVREVERVLAAEAVEAAFYAHASAGCLHIRPMVDLRTSRGVASLRSISKEVLALTLRLGGAMASEHGDGLARSEWLEEAYGGQIVDAMSRLKQAADPQGILNPGKIIAAQPMDTQFRFDPGYQSRAWETGLDFSRAGGLEMAIEQCNGQGVCRKDTGVMCPSYQATREEMDSTRGRANLLRSLISMQTAGGQDLKGPLPSELLEASHEALDLCLACKGCKAECPSGVDMAKIKFAFEAEYYKTHRRPLSDYLFGFFHVTAGILAPIAPLANLVTGTPLLRKGVSSATGISQQRPFPQFVTKKAKTHASSRAESPAILFLSDTYTRFIEPQVEQAAFDVLDAFGLRVIVLPIIGAGASMLSKSFISAARRHAARVLDHLHTIDPQCELNLVALEPPEIYCLKNDYKDLLPERRDEIMLRERKSWLLDEYLVRFKEGQIASPFASGGQASPRILFHPHCHEQAEAPAEDGLPNGTAASVELLKRCGYEVELIEAGCCGMAGTFGYEERHYQISQQVGELRLFPAIRKAFADRSEVGAPMAQIASTGSACRLQISQGTEMAACHPVELVARSMFGEKR